MTPKSWGFIHFPPQCCWGPAGSWAPNLGMSPRCPQVSPHLLRVQCHPEPDGGPVIHCVLGHQRRPPAQGHGLEHVPDGHLSVGLGSEVMGSHRGQWSHRGHMSLTATLALAWGQRSPRGQTEVMGVTQGSEVTQRSHVPDGHLDVGLGSDVTERSWGYTGVTGSHRGPSGSLGVSGGIFCHSQVYFCLQVYLTSMCPM